MSGKLSFEGFNIVFDDYELLDNEAEIKRAGIEFPNGGTIDFVYKGNTSTVLIIKEELQKHLISGTITIIHTYNKDNTMQYIVCSK